MADKTCCDACTGIDTAEKHADQIAALSDAALAAMLEAVTKTIERMGPQS